MEKVAHRVEVLDEGFGRVAVHALPTLGGWRVARLALGEHVEEHFPEKVLLEAELPLLGDLVGPEKGDGLAEALGGEKG